MFFPSRFKSLYLSFIFVISSHVFSSVSLAIEFVNTGPIFNNIEKIGEYDLANVSHVMQDSLGFTWLVNNNGVMRFDGYNIKNFPALAHINSFNLVTIIEGDAGRIWITTNEKGKELALFDSKSATLTFIDMRKKLGITIESTAENEQYRELVYQDGLLYLVIKSKLLVIDEKQLTLLRKKTLPMADNDGVIRLTITDNGDIWYSTRHGKGVFRFDSAGVHNYEHQVDNVTTISAAMVLNIFEDSKGRLWFSTLAGLDLFLPESNNFKRFIPFDLNKKTNKQFKSNANLLLNIIEDSKGYLWLALIHSGIVKFQPDTEVFTHYPHINGIDSTISTNSLYWGGLFIDRQQTIWALTEKGISKLSQASRGIRVWENIDRDDCTYKAMHQTDSGAIFTCNKMLYQFENNQIKLLETFEHRIFTIHQGAENNIWIGTVGGGIYRYDLATKKSKQYIINKAADGEYRTNTVEWLSTTSSGELYGIVQKHPQTKGSAIVRYQPLTDEFTSVGIDSLMAKLVDVDDTRMLMISNYSSKNNQLHWFNKNSETIKELPITTGIVFAALKWNEQLWVSTEKLGLISIDIDTGQWHELAKKRKDNILGLYLNTEKNTLYLNIKEHLYQLLAVSNDDINIRCITCILPLDSLQLNDHFYGQTRNSYSSLSTTGEFWLGADNRLIHFSVNPIVDREPPSQLILTDYKVMGKSIIPNKENKHALLKESIEHTSKLIIPPETSFFSFSFARAGASHPEKVKYAYKMAGINKNWRYVNATHTEAVFSLLPAGNYTFLVKSTDETGQWNDEIEPISLDVVVLPTWWQTWWAYSIYCTGILLLFWLVYRIKVAENARQSAEALAQAKEQVFANLSHEFRTPLTLILGPTKVIKDHIEDDLTQHNISLIERNAKRLLSMVDQLLQLAQLKDQQKDSTAVQHVASVCHFVLQAFTVIAKEKNISLKLHSEIDDSWWVQGTQNALDTILYNLFTNAVKFTPAGGTIVFEVLQCDQHLQFNIADSGCGIAEHEQSIIFDRFTRIENSEKHTAGVGIGLALVKELIQTLGGKISVESSLDIGSTFTFTLAKVDPVTAQKITREYHNPVVNLQQEIEQLNRVADNGAEVTQHDKVSGEIALAEHEQALKINNGGMPRALVVDDNQEMRAFIKQLLSGKYLVIEAEDGQQGLSQARAHSPDIIISDVMMPGMNGFEMLSEVRSDMSISHIPVILLTAKSDQQSKLQGLSDLADDYITKPFDSDILLKRMSRLLEIRTILQQCFLNNSGLQVKADDQTDEQSSAITELEQKFLSRFTELIEKNYSLADFSLSMISADLAMSERQLQRKLRATSGSSFSEILREYRLTQGHLLLNNGEQIAVIADKVGFGSSNYFVRCFKAKYGKTPNEYRKFSQ